jgi:hypothetical protein
MWMVDVVNFHKAEKKELVREMIPSQENLITFWGTRWNSTSRKISGVQKFQFFSYLS